MDAASAPVHVGIARDTSPRAGPEKGLAPRFDAENESRFPPGLPSEDGGGYAVEVRIVVFLDGFLDGDVVGSTVAVGAIRRFLERFGDVLREVACEAGRALPGAAFPDPRPDVDVSIAHDPAARSSSTAIPQHIRTEAPQSRTRALLPGNSAPLVVADVGPHHKREAHAP